MQVPVFFYLCLYSVFFNLCVYACVCTSTGASIRFCVCVRVRARTGVFVVGVRVSLRLLSVFACSRVFQMCNSRARARACALLRKHQSIHLSSSGVGEGPARPLPDGLDIPYPSNPLLYPQVPLNVGSHHVRKFQWCNVQIMQDIPNYTHTHKHTQTHIQTDRQTDSQTHAHKVILKQSG